MRSINAVLAFCTLAFCAGVSAAQAQSQPQQPACHLAQFGSVDLHVADGRVLMPVTIGEGQQDSILSLSSAFNYMSQEMMDQLKLHARSIARGLTLAGDIHKEVLVPEVRFGDVKMRDVEFLVPPKWNDGSGPQMTIGLEIFGKVDLDLDMAAKKLKFFSQDHCPGKAVYWTTAFTQVPFQMQDFGFVRPTLLLDGKPVSVGLALNSDSVISMGTMKALFGVDEKSPGMTLMGSNENGISFYRYPFKTLGTEDLKIGNPSIRVVGVGYTDQCRGNMTRNIADPTKLHSLQPFSTLYTCVGGQDLTLGYSVLSKLHMYFSMQEKVMYVSAANAH